MPRKPTRRTHLQKPQHAFSRLGRSMALLTSTQKVKQQNDIKPPFNSTGSKKAKHDTIEEASCSSSENEDSSSEDDFDGVVQADFAFFDPKPNDFHGVKVLMQTFLDNKEWDLTSFVDLILQQTTVGTVIKIEEDEDDAVYGFVSALNLQRYKANYIPFQHPKKLESRIPFCCMFGLSVMEELESRIHSVSCLVDKPTELNLGR